MQSLIDAQMNDGPVFHMDDEVPFTSFFPGIEAEEFQIQDPEPQNFHMPAGFVSEDYHPGSEVFQQVRMEGGLDDMEIDVNMDDDMDHRY